MEEIGGKLQPRGFRRITVFSTTECDVIFQNSKETQQHELGQRSPGASVTRTIPLASAASPGNMP